MSYKKLKKKSILNKILKSIIPVIRHYLLISLCSLKKVSEIFPDFFKSIFRNYFFPVLKTKFCDGQNFEMQKKGVNPNRTCYNFEMLISKTDDSPNPD